MAKMKLVLPDQTIKEMKKIYDNTEEIFGGMTRAGAEVVAQNVKASVPLSEMSSHVRISKTYRTPSDGSIKTKVYLNGYLPFKGNRKTFSRRGRSGGEVYTTTKGIPVAFLGQIYEYGRSHPSFPQKPFLRTSFKKAQIEQAMLKKQKELSGGLLDE